jgi:hypothetical protein
MPVFLAAKPRGLGLTDSPVSSHTLSAFLKLRAAACGLITGENSLEISLYAWRRHAGTKVDRTVSLDRARQFLHHSPTSDTFRKYYDSGIHDLDVFGIATDERQEITTDLDRQTLAAQRIEKRTLDREISIKRFVADSDEVIEAERKVRTSPPSLQLDNNLRLAIRRARYHAERSLNLSEKEITEQSMTIEEMRRRLAELRKPSQLLQHLKKLASTKDKGNDEFCDFDTDGTLIDSDFHCTEVSADEASDILTEPEDFAQSSVR